MSILDNPRTLNNLIKLTKGGFDVATYLEIKTAIQSRYKEIYGSDIDLATNTSDGIFVENICLIINNILQTFKLLYSNLDIRTASGDMLDALCALTGIYRRGATKSVAYMKLTNNSSTPIEINSSNQISFIDKSGLLWTTVVGDGAHSPLGTEITLFKDEPQSLPVYCEITGPNVANKGWINQLATTLLDLSFEQVDNAKLGSYQETDKELREKRNGSTNSYGLTVTSNLDGSLLNIGGVNDVFIYNNNSNNYINALDGTLVYSRSVYIITKQDVEIDDSIIGSVIYNKMTPGIPTCQSSGNFGVSHSYLYEDSDVLQNIVYWKKANPITSGIKITIDLNKFKGFNEILLEKTLREYINLLNVNENFTNYDLISYLNLADPMFNGLKTYQIYGIDISYTGEDESSFNKIIEGSSTTYQQKDTYFDLSVDDVEIDNTQSSKVIIEYPIPESGYNVSFINYTPQAGIGYVEYSDDNGETWHEVTSNDLGRFTQIKFRTVNNDTGNWRGTFESTILDFLIVSYDNEYEYTDNFVLESNVNDLSYDGYWD